MNKMRYDILTCARRGATWRKSTTQISLTRRDHMYTYTHKKRPKLWNSNLRRWHRVNWRQEQLEKMRFYLTF